MSEGALSPTKQTPGNADGDTPLCPGKTWLESWTQDMSETIT